MESTILSVWSGGERTQGAWPKTRQDGSQNASFLPTVQITDPHNKKMF